MKKTKKSLLIVLIFLTLSLTITTLIVSAAENDIQPVSPTTLTKEQQAFFDDFYKGAAVRSSTVLTDHLYTVGDVRQLYAIDNTFNTLYLEQFTVRIISDTVEIWVANDLNYYNFDGSLNNIHPGVDDAIHITDERLIDIATRLENDIMPTDVTFFGDYDAHNGVNAPLAVAPLQFAQFGVDANFSIDADHYVTDDGKRVIVLVQNIRDDQFYDPANNPSFVVGYYSSFLEQAINRNIITIDSASWDQRQGAPMYGYEATLAHEFQHLIFDDYHADAGDIWINEGLSEFAEWINGFRPDSGSHRGAWQNYPENSLTIWGDQSEDADQNFEILADYNQAYWFLLYMAGRMQEAGILAENDQFVSAIASLTRNPADAITAINILLSDVGAPFTFDDLWRDFRVQVALFGGSSDETSWGTFITEYSGASGIPIAPVELGRLRENLNFEGYDSAGVAPYATNYIEVGWSEEIEPSTTITLTPNTSIPFNWRIISAAETGITPTGTVTGNILYAPYSDLNDELILFNVTVPDGTPQLTFDALYDIELGWDYAFVQVTTDTVGATNLTSLPITGTRSDFNSNGYPLIGTHVPGFSGASIDANGVPVWQPFSHDMSAYAGQEILLALRYSTDWNTAGNRFLSAPGIYFDNIKIGDETLFDETFQLNVSSIYDLRGLGPRFEMDVVTFENGNGAAIESVETFAVMPSSVVTYNLGALLGTERFNEAGERIVIAVSQSSPSAPADLVSIPSSGAEYLLSGLPPSIFTSRNRAEGSTSDSTILRPRVYPGNDITMTITIDNLSRGGDLMTTGAVPAYVAVPFPPHTTYVTDSLTSDILATTAMVADDLSSVDSALPAVPGLYWYNEGVTMTADIQFQLSTAPTIRVGDLISPTAHIANAPFSDAPSQYFTDLEQAVSVTSPFALSRLTPATSNVTGTVTYTLELVNTDNMTREVNLQQNGITLVDDALATTYTVPSTLEGDTVIITFTAEVTETEDNIAITLINPTSGEPYTELGTRQFVPTAVLLQTNKVITTYPLLLIIVWMSALTAVQALSENKKEHLVGASPCVHGAGTRHCPYKVPH